MIYGAPWQNQGHHHVQDRIRNASPAKRPYEADGTEESQPHPGSQTSRLPYPPNMLSASVSCSFPQPMDQTPRFPYQPPIPLPAPDAQGRRPVSPKQRIQQSPNIGERSISTSAGYGDQRHLSLMKAARRQEVGPTLMGTNQAMLTLPGSDIPIPVPVDNTQASKKATKKREKDAAASSRHRQKKKEEQEKQDKKVEELEAEKDVMRATLAKLTAQVQELEAETDVMRAGLAGLSAQCEHQMNELCRLRDMVPSTGSIFHLVKGRPAGPTLSRPTRAMDGFKRAGCDYSSETSLVAMRSGLEDHGGSQIHTGTPTGTPGQTSFQGPVYGHMPLRPGSTHSSACDMNRLAPLRSIEGLGWQHSPQGPPQEQDWTMGPYATATKLRDRMSDGPSQNKRRA